MGDGRVRDDELPVIGGADPREPDPLAYAGGRVLGDPFDGLGGAAEAPGLELDHVARRPGAPAPEPVTPAPSPSEALDPAAISALADFGPPPAGLLGAVPYSVLVLTRKRALRAGLIDLHRLEQAAARDLDEALVELGRDLHAQGDADALSVLTRELAAADETGRLAGQRTQEWQQARDAAEAQRSSLSAKIEEAERAAAPYRDRETKLATQVSVRETDLRRAQARLSRVEIELRNLSSSPQADVARREMLEAEQQARRADVDATKAKLDEVAPQLTEARRELAVVLEALNDLVRQRQSVDAAEARSERAHLSSASEAERAYHAAVVELAKQALARGIAESVSPQKARAATRMQGALETRRREVAMHEAALRAYDPSAFHKGAALLGGAALLVLVTLLFVILR